MNEYIFYAGIDKYTYKTEYLYFPNVSLLILYTYLALIFIYCRFLLQD